MRRYITILGPESTSFALSLVWGGQLPHEVCYVKPLRSSLIGPEGLHTSFQPRAGVHNVHLPIQTLGRVPST